MPVWFTTLGFPDRRHRATLRQVLPAPPVKEEEGASSVVTYVALFDIANAGGELLSGMTAQVFFVTESAADVLAVPVSALDDDGSLRVQTPGARWKPAIPQPGCAPEPMPRSFRDWLRANMSSPASAPPKASRC